MNEEIVELYRQLLNQINNLGINFPLPNDFYQKQQPDLGDVKLALDVLDIHYRTLIYCPLSIASDFREIDVERAVENITVDSDILIPLNSDENNLFYSDLLSVRQELDGLIQTISEAKSLFLESDNDQFS